jgi:DNA-directed RNA polymerase specialized sigma24 family protein
MPSGWEAVHVRLGQSIRSAHGIRAYEGFKVLHPQELARFGTGADLVAFLTTVTASGGMLDDKDRILAALVRRAVDPKTSAAAIELLLLGLWPGLSMVFARLAHLYRRRSRDLTAELLGRFTLCARRLDLRRCNRVAATLVRNTHRVIAQARQTELRRIARERQLKTVTVDPDAERAAELVDLRSWLRDAVPRDADLILSVLIAGYDCHEAANRLGLTHATARQRMVRAFARIRSLLLRDVTARPFAGAFPTR